MGYINSIKIAMLVFPVLAFFITLPYMIINYRKYGSINKLRTLILYSFVLYLLTMYFLVILPLPDPNTVHTTYTQMLNLVPFTFIFDFLKESPFEISRPATWIMSIKDPTFYVPAFNVLMLIPFGVYLRYYFKCSFKKTLLLTALLSLFFELTQLTGLYFLYPEPYRLADIDDIIQNTTGGCIGYALGALAMWLLPSRDEIDKEALKAGSQVSQIRIGLSLLIDTFIVTIPYNFSKTTLPFSLFIALYFAVVPLFNGKTLGSALLRFKLTYEKQRVPRTMLRGLLITIYFYLIPDGLSFVTNEFNKTPDSMLFLALFLIMFVVFILFCIITAVLILMNKRFLFDRMSSSYYTSTVQNEQSAVIDTVETQAESQAEAEKNI